MHGERNQRGGQAHDEGHSGAGACAWPGAAADSVAISNRGVLIPTWGLVVQGMPAPSNPMLIGNLFLMLDVEFPTTISAEAQVLT